MKYIKPNWPAPSNIHAATTTREVGASIAPYDNFNLGEHVGDNPEHVTENRKTLVKALQLPSEPIWLKQIHSKNIIMANKFNGLPELDACIATQPGKVCVIMTADCLPILLCDKQGNEIAAVHAGWRGLVAGIISETISAIQTSPDQLLAWIGPAICQKHYEVGKEVYEQFSKQNDCFQKEAHGKWLMDMVAIATQQLKQLGIQDIYGGDLCTYCDPTRFYSYRRDGKTGRMATLIWRT